MYEKIGTLKEEKKQAIETAKQLGYTNKFTDLKDRINKAKSVTEVHNILITTRRAM